MGLSGGARRCGAVASYLRQIVSIALFGTVTARPGDTLGRDKRDRKCANRRFELSLGSHTIVSYRIAFR